MRPKNANYGYRIIGLQTGVVIAIALLWMLQGLHAGQSALLGGLASVLPNLYFVWRFFAKINARGDQVLRSFYGGELIKLFLTAALVIIILKTTTVVFVPFMTGFLGAYVGYWLAPVIR